MSFKLIELPFAKDELEPSISMETLNFHHGKHHSNYVEKLNNLIRGTRFEQCSLEDIVRQANGPIFNNAAQIWNHNFYWCCLSGLQNSHKPTGELVKAIEISFGGFDQFLKSFTQEALDLFGSGWVWLVKDSERLRIFSLENAGTSLRGSSKLVPLLVCDVWEHAYYIDYRNDRAAYLENFWKIVNWKFISENFAKGNKID